MYLTSGVRGHQKSTRPPYRPAWTESRVIDTSEASERPLLVFSTRELDHRWTESEANRLRHTFASELLTICAPIFTESKWLGHS